MARNCNLVIKIKSADSLYGYSYFWLNIPLFESPSSFYINRLKTNCCVFVNESTSALKDIVLQ